MDNSIAYTLYKVKGVRTFLIVDGAGYASTVVYIAFCNVNNEISPTKGRGAYSACSESLNPLKDYKNHFSTIMISELSGHLVNGGLFI